MVAITRRLHMGCGETLQSHLPESYRHVVLVPEKWPVQANHKQTQKNRQGKFLK